MDNFKIQILTQNWIDDVPDDGKDLCSHGKVLLMINNKTLSNENNGDWTVASSALRLMKSAIYGYNGKTEFELIPCCGYLRTFPSCTRSITWDAIIKDNMIILTNIECSEVEKDDLKILGSKFEIPYMEYATQILNYANKVKEFYSISLRRNLSNKYDIEDYEEFWREFNKYHKILMEKCYE